MSDICWTSHEWQEFTDKCIYDVEIFHDLVHRANDIYDNRVEKLLDSMTRIELYELPSAEPWQLETFLDKVKERCKEGSKELHKRSAMVEDAIDMSTKRKHFLTYRLKKVTCTFGKSKAQ